ncbi:SDR family oxidoreductase [Salibacterium aidingense]|uniref:SDR family oxidoreductase n=1 Tax=Salibacterium aidingense TaxID=384933 RepID=UPI00041C39E8|nr:SDR family NAD(P)-dependent oxidoreductase [Salibacterium aidingense]
MENYKELADKAAMVTGAGSGIGKAAALFLAEKGTRVGVLDINRQKAEETKHNIEKQGGEAVVLEADIASAGDMERSYTQLISSFERLDIVLANGGIAGTMAPIETMSADEWDRTIETNLRGTFLTIKYAVPFLKKQGGSIIITSSMSGNRVFSQPGFSAYSTAKAGQSAFMKMAASELAPSNIRVNAICPGGVKTDFKNSLHRADELTAQAPLPNPPGHTFPSALPEQIADLILFLASEASSHISGSDIYIDGGESLG